MGASGLDLHISGDLEATEKVSDRIQILQRQNMWHTFPYAIN